MLEQIKEDVRRYALEADREGLCRHRSGNFSIRDAESGLICITPTGMDRTEMTADDIVVINMDGHTIESLNERKPTSDVALMQAHGVVAVAENLKEVLLKASYLEELADIYCRCLTVLGREPDTIPADELAKWRYPTV